MTSTPEDLPKRISESDRDEVVRRLQEAFAEGLLTRDELDQRLHLALTATKSGELAPVLASLPGKEEGPSSKISVMRGRIKRRGDWRVPRVLMIHNEYGSVDLDLSHAIIEYPVTDIKLQLPYGKAKITLPRDAVVDLEDLNTVWKQPIHRPPQGGRAEGPRVRISGTMEYGRLKIRYRRR